ncbi:MULTISPECIES: type 4b pilus protein PilO2 [Cysteiniphilum]|nr:MULTISPECIES: type 4b pilus protein PilO2 [Cysteiniphilum]
MIINNYAVNLVWNIESNKKHFRKYNHGCYGLYVDGMKRSVLCEKNYKHKIPLAAALSLEYDNLIYLTDKLPLSDESGIQMYWVCVIENGGVVPSGSHLNESNIVDSLISQGVIGEAGFDIKYSGDMVLSREKVIEYFKFLSEKAKLLRNCKVIIELDDHALESSLMFPENIVNIEEFSLNKFLNTIPARARKNITIDVVKKDRKTFVFGSLLLSIIIFSYAYHKYSTYQASVASKENARAKFLALKKSQEEAQKKRNEEMLEGIKSKNAADIIKAMNDALKRVVYLKHGWGLKEISVDDTAIKELKYLYERREYANLDMLMKLRKILGSPPLELSLDQNKGTFIIPLNAKIEYSNKDINALIANVDIQKKYLVELVSKIQSSALKYTITADERSIKQDQKVDASSLALGNRKISIIGTGYLEFLKFTKAIQQNPFLMLKSMKIQFNDEAQIQRWSFEGVIYA